MPVVTGILACGCIGIVNDVALAHIGKVYKSCDAAIVRKPFHVGFTLNCFDFVGQEFVNGYAVSYQVYLIECKLLIMRIKLRADVRHVLHSLTVDNLYNMVHKVFL